MKKGNQTEMLIEDISSVMEVLDEVAKIAVGIKPYFYTMKAYYAVLHACHNEANAYLLKAEKFARKSNDLMALAWIICSRKVRLSLFFI